MAWEQGYVEDTSMPRPAPPRPYMAALNRLLWPAVAAISLLLSVLGYCWDGRVPLLLVGERGGLVSAVAKCPCRCPIQSTSPSPPELPVGHGGASKMLATVTMSVLKEKVSLRTYRGLSQLDHVSLSRYYLCPARRVRQLPGAATAAVGCTERRFKAAGGPVVALASFHGSGNTWVRHLLEQASGIFTGSIYCDRSLKLAFPGEQVVGPNVLVAKTHQSDSTELPLDVQQALGRRHYHKAIVLVRNPFDALVSEANRRWNTRRDVDSHVGLAEEAAFFNGAKWDWYVEGKGMAWGLMLHTWLTQREFPILLVSYEALLSNTRTELARMLEFLEVKVDKNALQCAVENGTGHFKRTRHLNFDPFSQENVESVNRIIAQATPLLLEYGVVYHPKH